MRRIPAHLNIRRLAVLGLLGLALVACSDTTAEETGNRTQAAGREVAVNVSVEEVRPTSFQSRMKIVGEVDSEHYATLSAESGGTLVKIHRKRGARVAKGDTLLEIDSRRARAAFEIARANYENMQLDFDSIRRQYEEGLGVSETEFRKARNGMTIARAQMDEAGVQLGNCFVIAPFSGLVDERFAKLGELVVPGAPLVKLVDNEHLKVVCGVPENLAGFLQTGQPARVTIREADIESPATVRWVAAAINTRDRTITTELSIDDGGGELKPGMVCEVVIDRKIHKNSVVVPLNVIQQSNHSDYVYVAEGGKAHKRTVVTAERDGTRVRLSSGLAPGEMLVISGFRDIVDGQAIQIVKGNNE
ncbi:MAG: efflux RND transporter periplasmic adaptor subunit [Candidatus Cloacimonetes bacterium]|nr:efflux RND transporter periplasmic adaptor subunit [Candidatus Cloacimonadota bacterium]